MALLSRFYDCFKFQYPFIINATTNDGEQLTDFEVYIDGSNSTETLDTDNMTTLNTFVFGDTHDIIVKKVGHQNDNETSYVIKDPENMIHFFLAKKRVISI